MVTALAIAAIVALWASSLYALTVKRYGRTVKKR